MIFLLRSILLFLLFPGFSVLSTTMTISAAFNPDLNNPGNVSFKNTTPQSGYCASYPSQCQGAFSISLGGITAKLSKSGFTANSPPREGLYFSLPGSWVTTTVVNKHDKTRHDVKFRVSFFSARYLTKNKWTATDHRNNWNGSSFVNVPKPCGYSGIGWYGTKYYLWMWKWPESNSACYKTAKKNLIGEPYLVDNMSFGYELQTPSPLQMDSGVYEGTLKLSVGPGGDIDFGDNLTPSSTELNINLVLTVNHELKVTPASGATNVTLYPCYHGTTCSEGETEKNWERWMVTNIPPQQMRGTSRFNISSSGSFTVYMACGSGAALIQDRCPMISTKSGTVVPVKALLTLPENILSETSQRVISQPLYTEKDISRNKFRTRAIGKDRQGQVDFIIDKKDISEMLKSRPDSWSGSVTLIFDPNLY